MITVAILINGKPIAARSAINRGTQPDGRTRYEVDDGGTVLHRREDGAVRLAVKLLRRVRELGGE